MGSRPSTVQRATSSLITSPLQSPTSSDQVPNSLGQYQPRKPASWRPPRTSTPPASTSQRLTGRVLERTKTSQVRYLLFKAAQLTTTANHHHHDEPRSHRSVLKLLLPLLSPFISLIMSPVIMSQMPCSQLSVFSPSPARVMGLSNMTRMTKDSSRPGSSRLQQEETSEEDPSREPPWIWKGRAEFFQTIPSTNRRQIIRRKSTPQEELSTILASSDFTHDSHLHNYFVFW